MLAGGAGGTARLLSGIFTAARPGHSIAYPGGEQPWRTIVFILGGLATIALLVNLGWQLA